MTRAFKVAVLVAVPLGTLGWTRSWGGPAIPASEARLLRPASVEPRLHPISGLLDGVEHQSGVPLSLAPNVPDLPVFVSWPGKETAGLLQHLRLLMTDDEWKYAWGRKPAAAGGMAYRFQRSPMDPADRKAYAQKMVRERLKRLLDALKGGPEALNRLAEDDPDMAARLKSPMFQARLGLVGELSPLQLNGVLAGRPFRSPVGRLSPAQRGLVDASCGGMTRLVMRSPDGSFAPKVLFDRRQVGSGELVITASSRPGEPGGQSIRVEVYTGGEEAKKLHACSGGDVLYGGGPVDEFASQRERGQQLRQQEKHAAVASNARGSKIVTIDPNTAGKDEKPLAAYLREFARQTRLPVLAFWPKEAREPAGKLSRPIVNAPVGEALDALCRQYRCEWERDDSVVRIRYRSTGPAERTTVASARQQP